MNRIIRTLGVAALASALVAPPAMATGAGPAPAPQPKPATEFRNTCDPSRAVLPGVVEGDPGLKPGARSAVLDGSTSGLYVWHDKRGWRVRYTHNLAKSGTKAQRVDIRGVVTSSRPITDVRLVKLEPRQRGEWVSVKRPRRAVLDFRFVNYGYIDGFNFRAGCAGDLTFTAWQVTKDAQGKVVRTPIPVFVGAKMTRVVDPVPANPGLVAVPTNDATKVRIRRTPPVSAPVAPVPAPVPAA